MHYPENRRRVGQEAVELAAAASLVLDPWQSFLLSECLAESDEVYYNDVLGLHLPKYAAYEFGACVSRQNGKGSFLEARAVAGLFLLGERTIIWTAHEQATAREGFRRIEALIEGYRPFRREVAHIYHGNGNEMVELKTGQRLLFKTRTKGAVRGFSPDVIIFDEAMILDSDQVAAMLFSLSARPNAQLIYTGSAGTEESIHFGNVRRRGIDHSDPRLFYAEWSTRLHDEFCPPGCDEHYRPDQLEAWAESNPGLGIRITPQTVQSEYNSLKGEPEKFEIERLGIGRWPVDGDAWAVIDKASWYAQEVDELSQPKRPLLLAVDVKPDGSWSCITVAGLNDDGMADVQVTYEGVHYDHRPGVAWVVPRLKELYERHQVVGVVLYPGSRAGAFQDELEAAHLKVLTPATREYAQACGEFLSGIKPRRDNKPSIVHHGQPMLNEAVAGAEKRDTGDMWIWDRRNVLVDISPLVSATLAVWGLRKTISKPKPKPMFAWG